MNVINAGETGTVLVPVGYALNFPANSNGTVVIVPFAVTGGEPGTPVVYAGSSLSFGPFEIIKTYKLTGLLGSVSYTVDPVAGVGHDLPYSVTVDAGKRTSVFLAAGQMLDISGAAFGSIVRIKDGASEPFAPVGYAGNEATFGPFASYSLWLIFCDVGQITAKTTATLASAPSTATVAITGGPFTLNIGDTGPALQISVVASDGSHPHTAIDAPAAALLAAHGITYDGTNNRFNFAGGVS